TRLDQKGRKFAKNAIGYAFFNAHFRLFLKTSLRNSLRTPASQHIYSKEKAYDPFFETTINLTPIFQGFIVTAIYNNTNAIENSGASFRRG
ncbi:hypothetical protein HYV57_00180, partial [Candidatus Peregrinibacteria bacterium]|nr:hypothetical protein [Candidatus Peregrinibacteria bacterium]